MYGASAAARSRRSSGGERLVPLDHRAERLGLPALGEERLGGADDVQRVALALLGGVAPGGDAVAAQDTADGLRVGLP